MDRFDDNEYKDLIKNLLHDTQYIERSNMGKLAGLRQYAEVLVRKILDIGSNYELMLGQVRRNSRNSAVSSRLESFGEKLSNRLIEILNRIRPLGNKGSHTQRTEEFSKEEVESVENAILDLYALIFIKYFMDIQVNLYSSPEVLRLFSLLPPVIRYKTWKYLFEKDKNNIQVVDKLCLAIIKCYDKEMAFKWLEDNAETIKAIPYPDREEIDKYDSMHIVEVLPGTYVAKITLNFDEYDNMYDLLLSLINDPRTSVNESGKMYKSFEEAVKHYKNYKKGNITTNSSEEMSELCSLMDFVYLGRVGKSEIQN